MALTEHLETQTEDRIVLPLDWIVKRRWSVAQALLV